VIIVTYTHHRFQNGDDFFNMMFVMKGEQQFDREAPWAARGFRGAFEALSFKHGFAGGI
jgi:hypothetical protein